ncbi:hypothetical protein, partial [Streptomyces sp. JV178]|uniref:hypothetical protein n=1 Tax=Streptomyces sp. JV178 TaxID=858632 RepID=UPI001C557498
MQSRSGVGLRTAGTWASSRFCAGDCPGRAAGTSASHDCRAPRRIVADHGGYPGQAPSVPGREGGVAMSVHDRIVELRRVAR